MPELCPEVLRRLGKIEVQRVAVTLEQDAARVADVTSSFAFATSLRLQVKTWQSLRTLRLALSGLPFYVA